MSKTNEGMVKSGGKAAVRRVPQDVDLEVLNYLEYRDITRIAEELKQPRYFVSRVRRGETYNVKVLAALLKKARENKKAIEAAS